MSFDKLIGAFSPIESKKISNTWGIWWNKQQTWEKTQPHSDQKHQDENASEASDFLCTRFEMSSKHLEPVTAIRNQYMFLQEVEKKDTNSPSRKQEKNAPINQVIFHQIANSRFFLNNPRIKTFAGTNHP